MKKTIIAVLVATAALVLPALASAHTGSVSCTKAGVTFSYNANFAHTTVVTENVNGVTKLFTVPKNTTVTDTVSTTTPNVVAGATWKDGTLAGSIPFTSLTGCGTPPPPPPPPPPTCVSGTKFVSFVGGVLTCERTVTVVTPPPPPVTNTVTVIQYVDRWHPGKVIHKTRTVTKTKTKIKRILVPWCPQPKHRKSEVLG